MTSRARDVVDVGGGDHLIFLHGWGLGPKPYLPALRALAARGFRVLAPDLRSCGEVWTAEGCMQVIEEVRRDLGEGGLVVVGHSLGGGLALRHAAAHPEHVACLVIVDSVGVPQTPNVRRLHAFLRYAGTCPVSCLGNFLSHLVTPRGLADLTAAAIWASRVDLLDEASACRRTATTVLWGAEDRLLPVSDAGRLAAAAGAELRILDRFDHDWPLRHPEIFADVIAAAAACEARAA